MKSMAIFSFWLCVHVAFSLLLGHLARQVVEFCTIYPLEGTFGVVASSIAALFILARAALSWG
ncbi:hypothetical protein [Pseudomonas sp. 2FE]|uniref:hypothetical protein n=1 Tax=Pseudomonas sp. 2FE TaxID=2502190 RepID=UPI0010F76241|nr:hypothetical protein [Pseudomonas sp. 2FE]